MRRLLIPLLGLFLLASCGASSSMPSFSSQSHYTSWSFSNDAPRRTKVGDLWFTLKEDGTYKVSDHSTNRPGTIAIPSYLNDRPVTEIEAHGYSGSFGQFISIPNTIEIIGEGAFADCRELLRVEMPKHLRVIGPRAFMKCPKLNEIIFNDELREIGEEAFRHTKLQSLSLPASLKNLSGRSFSGMSELKELSFKETNPFFHIHDHAIYTRDDQTLIRYFGEEETVSVNVETIDDCAFYENERIQSVSFGPKTRRIGEEAFDFCPKLEKVALNEGLLSIGHRGIYTAKEPVVLPKSLQGDPYRIIAERWDRYPIIVPPDHPYFEIRSDCLIRKRDKALIWALMPQFGDIVIPEGVERIEDQAFAFVSSAGAISISFPSSLRHIGKEAFASWMITVSNITFNEGLLSIGDFAFEGLKRESSSGLSEEPAVLKLPATLEELGTNALPSIAPFEVDETNAHFTSKDGFVFDKEMKTMIKAPRAVDSYALPEGVETIGDYAFYKNEGAMGIEFPSSLRMIEENAFFDTSIACLDISKTKLTAIGSGAFIYCRNLSEVSFPRTLERIEASAFGYCAISELDFSKTSLTYLGDEAFFGGDNHIESVLLSDTLSELGYSAFGFSQFASLSLPVSIRKLSDFCFAGSFSLKRLEYEGTMEQWDNVDLGWWVQCNCHELTSVFCLDGEVLLPSPEA